MVDRQLKELLSSLESAKPPERIGLRDPILAFGRDCIAPLEALVVTRPDLNASVASWFATLGSKDSTTRIDVDQALRRLARKPEGRFAKEALERLKGADYPATGHQAGKPRPPRRDAGAEVHARVLQAAKDRRLIIYGDLETSRGHIGNYLRRIVEEEADAGHPPLTAIVVSKSTGRPGDGFLPAMLEIGYATPGETLADVWQRAVAEVFEYWGGQA